MKDRECNGDPDGGSQGEPGKVTPTEPELLEILSHIADHAILQDSEHRILWANRAAAESLGLSVEDLIGKRCHELWQGRDEECPDCPPGRAWSSRRLESSEVESPDGRSWSIKGFPVLDDEGNVGHVVEVTTEITRQRTAEEALVRSEQRFRSLVESAPLHIMIIDRQGVISFVNRAFEGVPMDEVLGCNAMDFVIGGDPGHYQGLLGRIFDGGEKLAFDAEARYPDGREVWYRVTAGPIVGGDEVELAILIVQDITAERAALEALERSEERYKSFYENIRDASARVDRQGRIVEWNSTFLEIVGYTGEELVELTYRDITPERWHDMEERILRTQADVRGYTDVYEEEYKRKDGTLVPIDLRTYAVRDGSGNVEGYYAIIRDISERKAAQRALEESERRYRLVAENVADVIFTMGMDLVFDYVSPSFERLTGYTVEEFRSMTWQDMLTERSLESATELVAERLIEAMASDRRPAPVMVEMEVVCKDGSAIWIEANLSVLLDGTGKEPTGLLGVARDVSERKQILERIEDERNRAELYLDLFGHDISNLNQGVMSYLELLQQTGDLGEDQARYLERILAQSNRINELVNKVHRLTVLQEAEMVPGPVRVFPLVDASVERVRRRYDDRRVEVRFKERDDSAEVMGSEHLSDVFTNVLDNAVRFDRHETVVVDVACRREGRAVVLSFTDRGPGIPDEMKQRVFRRLEARELKDRGTGLGLTLANEVLKKLGGGLRVEDRIEGAPNQGCRVVVELEAVRE